MPRRDTRPPPPNEDDVVAKVAEKVLDTATTKSFKRTFNARWLMRGARRGAPNRRVRVVAVGGGIVGVVSAAVWAVLHYFL